MITPRGSRILVADIGASHVACGAFSARRDGKLILDHAIVETFSADPGTDAAKMDEIARAMGKIGRELRQRGAMTIAVPGHIALTKFIKTPAVECSKRSRIIQFEASQNIPYPLTEVVWDHLLVAESGLDLEILLTAAKTDLMLGLCAAVSGAGYMVTGAVPSCVALHDAFRYNYPEVNTSVLVVDVGARSIHLLFVEDGRFFPRTLPFGGNAITQSIADELLIDFPTAEKIKREVLNRSSSQLPHDGPSFAVQRAVGNFCSRLYAEIVRSTASIRRPTTAQLAAVYTSGGGSQFEALAQLLGEKLNVPVQRLSPLRNVGVSSSASTLKEQGDADFIPQLVGLAARVGAKNPPAAELLPPVIRDELGFRRRQPALIAAAVFVLLALLPPIRYFHHRAEAAQNQAKAMELQLEPLQEQQKRQSALMDQISRASASVAELQDIVDKKNNWLCFLKDLQDRLVAVEDVWVEAVSLVRPPVSPSEELPGDIAQNTDLRLLISGRLLDRNNPVSKVSAESYERVKQLSASFAGSEYVAAVEQERFDNSQPGILRFDFTLVVRSQNPL